MNHTYFECGVFEGINYSSKPLARGEYEQCQFINCDFSQNDLSQVEFTDCIFRGCNLSMVRLTKTTLNDVTFTDCKLLGANFEHCNEFLFQVGFENCMLNLASFYKRTLTKTSFTGCSLHEVDFAEADLTQASFPDCDLAGAKFDQTNLEKADLSKAYNYSIDPFNNKIRKAIFSLPAAIGLLHHFDVEIV